MSVHVVWLPMFPRLMEWWALPGMVEEFAGWGVPQYWDDENLLSREVKRRIVPEVDSEIPWDIFILLGPEATWATAEEHVLGWGGTVVQEMGRLKALLSGTVTAEP